MIRDFIRSMLHRRLSFRASFRFTLICFFFAFGFSPIVQAQQNKAENTLLWEISGKDLNKPSYLFGTYHFADKGFVDTMTVLNEKLKTADAIVGELIMDSALALKLMPYMMMKGNTLDKLLNPTEYKLVDEYLKKIGGPDLKLFNNMKPVVVQTLIMQANSPVTFTNTNPQLDQSFQDYAKANKKKVLGLETMEDQATVLFGGSLERQKELLINSIKNAEKNKSDVTLLYQNYISQDLNALERNFTDNNEYTEEEMDKLLKNRNEKWLAVLPKLMQEQSLFIVVGVGHFLGKDGLIKGLRKQGYTVKPISTK